MSFIFLPPSTTITFAALILLVNERLTLRHYSTMPTIQVFTNVAKGDVPSNFHTDITDMLCKMFKKTPRVGRYAYMYKYLCWYIPADKDHWFDIGWPSIRHGSAQSISNRRRSRVSAIWNMVCYLDIYYNRKKVRTVSFDNLTQIPLVYIYVAELDNHLFR